MKSWGGHTWGTKWSRQCLGTFGSAKSHMSWFPSVWWLPKCVSIHIGQIWSSQKKSGSYSNNIRCQLPLAPFNAICVLKKVPTPLHVRRKKSFSNCPLWMSLLILKVSVKYKSKINVKSGGDDCTTLWIYLIPPSVQLKWLKWETLCFVYFIIKMKEKVWGENQCEINRGKWIIWITKRQVTGS